MSSLVWTAATLFALAGGIASFYENGLRNELLSIARTFENVASTSTPDVVKSTLVSTSVDSAQPPKRTASRGLLPLPSPTSDGVILLTEHGPYDASTAVAEGQLIIRGTAEAGAEIQIGSSPLSLASDLVVLERLTVRHSSAYQSDSDSTVAMVMVRSQQLRIVNCEFLGSNEESSDVTHNSPHVAAIAWKTLNPRSRGANTIEVTNSLFHGDGVSMILAQTPGTVQIENTLKTGRGEFLSLGPKSEGTGMHLGLDHVTLRHSGPLLWVAGASARTTGSTPIAIRASNCVFNLADVNAGLIVIDDAATRKDVSTSVEMKALESVVEPGAILLSTFGHQQNRHHPIDADDQFEGLVASEFKFRGENIRSAGDATIEPIQGPRTSENARPGIDAALIGPSAG